MLRKKPSLILLFVCVHKDTARYVFELLKTFRVTPETSYKRVKKKSFFSFFRAQPMFGPSKTLP